MSTKIIGTIPTLTVNNLIFPNLTHKMLYRGSSPNTIGGVSLNQGIAMSTSASSPPTFEHANAYVMKGWVQHESTAGSDYSVTLSNTDSYPYIFFECFTHRMASNMGSVQLTPKLYCVLANNTVDTGTNYSQQGYYQSTTTAHALTATTSTAGIAIGYVYSATSTSTLRQSYIVGQGDLRSGGMRTFSLNGIQSNATIYGGMKSVNKWSNTADVIPRLVVSVPNDVYVTCRIYQRMYV